VFVLIRREFYQSIEKHRSAKERRSFVLYLAVCRSSYPRRSSFSLKFVVALTRGVRPLA
jgi:hypothetical protein